MENLKDRAENHLSKMDGKMGPLEARSLPSLPLFLRERYSVYSTGFLGRNWMLAVEAEGWDTGTPAEYRRHWQELRRVTGESRIAIVLPFISSTVRNRMVDMGVPFIVPDAQIFLPECATLLTENFGTPLPDGGKPLTPPAQLLLLIELEKGGLEELSAKQLSERIGYSRASLSNATSELKQNNLCQTYRDGKEQRIAFRESGKALWEMALPLLRSPISKTQFVVGAKPLPDAKCAGISALAQRSLLAEDPVPVYALPSKRVREGIEEGRFSGGANRYEADAQLEAWRYNPAILSNGTSVDDLSLFLSLRNTPDERVQAALDEMMAGFLWR